MAKKTTIKKRITISDSQLKSEILSLFNSGQTGKTDLYGVVKTKLKCSLGRDRYFKMYDVCYSEWSKLKEKANSQATILAAEEAAKIGLKSKLEKQLHLQKQIDDIQADINSGIIEDYFVIMGKVQFVKKVMNAETKAQLRKVIKDIYAELNKMDGDYAPTKIANTNKNGDDIEQIDYSQYTDAELRTLAKLQSKGRASKT